MSTFVERESKEDKYAWPKFQEWLERGEWRAKRFRYAKDLTSVEIDSLSLSEGEKIRFRQILKKIDFDHDGIMHRHIETYFFDLKYKSKERFRNWVNQDHYKAYYELGKATKIPFLIVVHAHDIDKLYFHRVRDPEQEPKLGETRFWDNKPAKYGGQNWVYKIPKEEYLLVTGFNFPWKTPESIVDYYALCRKVEDAYAAWKEGKVVQERDHVASVVEEMKAGYPKPWKIFDVPLAQKGIYPDNKPRKNRKNQS